MSDQERPIPKKRTIPQEIAYRILGYTAILLQSEEFKPLRTPDQQLALLLHLQRLTCEAKNNIADNLKLIIAAMPENTSAHDAMLNLECMEIAEKAVQTTMRELKNKDIQSLSA
jgi:hypothetical protein